MIFPQMTPRGNYILISIIVILSSLLLIFHISNTNYSDTRINYKTVLNHNASIINNNDSIDNLDDIIDINTMNNTETVHVCPKSLSWLNLSTYQLILNNRTSDPNSYHSNTWSGVSIKSQTFEYCMTAGSGLGNVLSMYWAARAMAYFTNLTFILLEECPGIGRSITYLTSDQRNTFTRFLSQNTSISYFDYHISNITATKLEYNLLLLLVTNFLHHFGGYPYHTELQLIYYNPAFLPIMISETNTALKLQMNADQHKLFTFGVNDVVIHFRCGDVIAIKNPDYGFLTLSFYKKAIEFININYTSLKISNMSVFLLTQTGKNSLRTWTATREHKYKAKCIQFVDQYIPHIRKLFFNKFSNFTTRSINFIIIGNGFMNQDFYKMVFAPNFIASMSSFAQQAAFINTNNIILPNWGPWKKLANQWIHTNNLWTPTNHKYIDVRFGSKLYIDSKEYYGWNVERLVQYLITH